MKTIENILFREKPFNALLTIFKSKDNIIYSSLIAKEINCTYSHVVKLLHFYEKIGLIKIQKEGRTKQLFLTQKGFDLCYHLNSIKNLF